MIPQMLVVGLNLLDAATVHDAAIGGELNGLAAAAILSGLTLGYKAALCAVVLATAAVWRERIGRPDWIYGAAIGAAAFGVLSNLATR